MKLLLDTHIWVWCQVEPERLGRRVRAALTDPKSELWLSPVSVWELLLLVERGRIVVAGDGAGWVEMALARAPMKDAPLTREVAARSRALALPHEDPADRFIAATAAVYELTLVTADPRLLAGKGYRTMTNR